MKQVHILPAYTVDGFCEAFGIGKSTFYVEVRAKRLPTFKIGDRRMVAGEDGIAWRDAYRSAQPQQQIAV